MTNKEETLADLDIGTEVEDASKTLEMMGLSPYEARAYMSLVAHGYGTAEEIAQTARIPRTSCYKVMDGLEEKGLTYHTEGRPRLYRPEPPGRVKSMIQARLDDTFDKLEVVYNMLKDRGMPQLVYTIMGRQKVMEKLGELLDTSTKRFVLSTPTMLDIRKNLGKKMETAMKRGVEVMVITSPGQKIPPGVQTFRRKGLVATDAISDSTRALIASPELDACGYTDNPALSQHLENFLEILMENPGVGTQTDG